MAIDIHFTLKIYSEGRVYVTLIKKAYLLKWLNHTIEDGAQYNE